MAGIVLHKNQADVPAILVCSAFNGSLFMFVDGVIELSVFEQA
ncbi:MAG TPA: hypothetical protein VMW36_01895 [Patescibacteria group bacterium]|nr:hypothetical protein [Patescibacteria group bacterium]